MKEFDLEELSNCDGKDGKPSYIAHQGKVFNVSTSKLWPAGLHMKRHHAGKDLTTDIKAAPHGTEVLERYPEVGILTKEDRVEKYVPLFISRLIAHYPMLRRHPHPMTVHFPIVFALCPPFFNLLYLLTGINSFETTALHSLGAGILMTPVAIITGLITWQVNYIGRTVRAVTIKKRLSPILWLIMVVSFIWRISVPDLLEFNGFTGYIYLALIVSLVPLVSIIGWFGATLTFPIERN
jgi:predicted heme/steroid binding protein